MSQQIGMTKDESKKVHWVNFPDNEPGIVLCYWDVLGQRSSIEEATHVTATNRFGQFVTFRIDENTFEEVVLQ